jgi:hypothetical protein
LGWAEAGAKDEAEAVSLAQEQVAIAKPLIRSRQQRDHAAGVVQLSCGAATGAKRPFMRQQGERAAHRAGS